MTHIPTSTTDIPEADFQAMLAAVKARFGGLPDTQDAAIFAGQWVADNYPPDTPATVALAFMRRYGERVKPSP